MSTASTSKLYKYLKENPNEESYLSVVQLPKDTRLEDWLSVVTIEIYDNISTLYSSLSHCCTNDACPTMSIGLSHEYLWHEFQDTNSSIKHKKMHCSAPQYIHLFLSFVQDTISNSAIFPIQSTNHYTPNFLSIIKFICKVILISIFIFYAFS